MVKSRDQQDEAVASPPFREKHIAKLYSTGRRYYVEAEVLDSVQIQTHDRKVIR